MKRILTILLISCFTTFAANAQDDKGAEIEKLKIAFLSKQLDLTVEEAQKFWPVFNSYEKEWKQLLKDNRDNGSDELKLQEARLNLTKKYKPEFLKVISEEKFNRLLKAQNRWHEMLREELQRRKEERQNRPGARRFGN